MLAHRDPAIRMHIVKQPETLVRHPKAHFHARYTSDVSASATPLTKWLLAWPDLARVG